MLILDNAPCKQNCISLVHSPFEEEEKGPGTHCLNMLCYPKNHAVGLDIL